jgi:hypothetical protein
LLGDVEQDPYHPKRDDQARPAIADEREGQASDRQDPRCHPEVDDRLEADGEEEARPEEEAELVRGSPEDREPPVDEEPEEQEQ